MQYFLQIPGISGNSWHKQFPKWIEIESLYWNLENMARPEHGSLDEERRFSFVTAAIPQLMLPLTHRSAALVVLRGGTVIYRVKFSALRMGMVWGKIVDKRRGVPMVRIHAIYDNLKYEVGSRVQVTKH